LFLSLTHLPIKINYHRSITMADNNNNNNNNSNIVSSNSHEAPAVHLAACINNVAELKRLIEEEGHSPTLTFDYVYRREGRDDRISTRSPLILATQSGATDAMLYLLNDCKVDPNIAYSRGERAIHEALFAENTACLRLLLKHGADINAPTADGTSLLMMAVIDGNEELFTALLESKDCDVNLARNNGATALDEAVMSKKWHFAKMLLERGARPFLVFSDGWVIWLDEFLTYGRYEDAPEDFVKLVKAIVGEAHRANLLHRYRQVQDMRYKFAAASNWFLEVEQSELEAAASAHIPCCLLSRTLDKNGKWLEEPKQLPRVTLSPPPPPPRRSKRKRTEAEVEEEEQKEKERETYLAVVEYITGAQEEAVPVWVAEGEEEREGRPRIRMLDEHFIELMEMMLPAWDDNEQKRGKKAKNYERVRGCEREEEKEEQFM
jgi:hypothetical protein